MKIARATPEEIDSAINLLGILEEVQSGHYPPAANGEEQAEDGIYFDDEDYEHLKVFHDRVIENLRAFPGGLSRVIWGFQTVIENNVINLKIDALELHPRILKALAK